MESADKAVIRRCMNDRAYSGTDSILAIEDVKAVERIEFTAACRTDAGCVCEPGVFLPEYRRRR